MRTKKQHTPVGRKITHSRLGQLAQNLSRVVRVSPEAAEVVVAPPAPPRPTLRDVVRRRLAGA
jgi:hypothetical protein